MISCFRIRHCKVCLQNTSPPPKWLPTALTSATYPFVIFYLAATKNPPPTGQPTPFGEIVAEDLRTHFPSRHHNLAVIRVLSQLCLCAPILRSSLGHRTKCSSVCPVQKFPTEDPSRKPSQHATISTSVLHSLCCALLIFFHSSTPRSFP